MTSVSHILLLFGAEARRISLTSSAKVVFFLFLYYFSKQEDICKFLVQTFLPG